ncbi:unnamed protein product [Calicophoron daubneyi]|uniref:C2H2-type domain-containing protein n=1 Tax=Calicophoron daubneyi TaxID=300641 RepID=A0AAV2TBZ5_CALDB
MKTAKQSQSLPPIPASTKMVEVGASDDLLQVAVLEHIEAMRKAFREYERLNMAEFYHMYATKNSKQAKATIFRIRQLSASRRTEQLRWQALKRRQTAAGPDHVRLHPPRLEGGYRCYFCPNGFSTVTALHAHLLTQEHLCMELPTSYAEVASKPQVSRQENNNNSTEFHPFQVDHRQHNTNRTDGGRGKKTEKLEFKNILLPYCRCKYCGGLVQPDALVGHQCFEEMNSFITSEIEHMNLNGSPFVCLLCHGRVYDTPAQLQLHLVTRHGTEGDFGRCPLCGVQFRRPLTETPDAHRLSAIVYQKHLTEEHLPKLELVQKLVYMDSPICPRSASAGAPRDNVPFRAYRCIFYKGSPAGKGPRFPFPHWLKESMFPGKRSDNVYGEITGAFSTDEPDFHPKSASHTKVSSASRPSKFRVYRSRLVSSGTILSHLDRAIPGAKSFEIAMNHQWCTAGHSGSLSSLPELSAHVMCRHAGNTYTVPGTREMVRARHAFRMMQLKHGTVAEVEHFIQSWLRCKQQHESQLTSAEHSKQQDAPMLQQLKQSLSSMQSKNSKIFAGKTSANQSNVYITPSYGYLKSNISGSSTSYSSRDIPPIQEKMPVKNWSLWLAQKNEMPEIGRPAGLENKRYSEGLEIIQTYQQAEYTKETSPNLRGKSGGKENVRSSISADNTGRKVGRFSYIDWQTRNNTGAISDELVNKLASGWKDIYTYCRACMKGPFGAGQGLSKHVISDHSKALEAHMIQMRRSGVFSSLIDPMKTCLECYTILEDHFAFQVHMAVMHGSRYSFVCGLCKQPLVSYTDSEEIRSLCMEIFKESNVRETTIKLAKLSQSRVGWKLSESDLVDEIPKPSSRTNPSRPDSFIHRLLEIDELRAVYACVEACVAIETFSPQYAFKSISTHELMHERALRKRYMPNVNPAESVSPTAKMQDLYQLCQFQGPGQTMLDHYKDTYLTSGEEHERQLEVEQVRFGVDAWQPEFAPYEPVKLSEVMRRRTMVEKNEVDNPLISAELRRRFEEIHQQSSVYD